MRLTKKKKEILKLIDKTKVYELEDAIGLLQKQNKANFVESVDVAVRLGIDPKKSDQSVRGAVVLPAGTGKKVVVAVFSQDSKVVEEARNAGADIVGGDDLLEDISKDIINFDVLITTPNMMAKLAKLGQKLGPKGLMPNPKTGTISPNVGAAIEKIKKGQISFRADSAGVIRCSIGKIDFDANKIKDNIDALISEINSLKPSSAKGIYIKKINLSSTMGGGVSVNTAF